MTTEELKKMSPEQLLAYTQKLQDENSKKDEAINSLTEEIVSSAGGATQLKLKLGKKSYVMKYSKIRQDGVVYSYEDLSKDEKLFEKILKNDEGSFELMQ